MAHLDAGRAVALAAGELREASRALQAVEQALIVDARPVEGAGFPRDLQTLDLLAQSIEELRLYLDRLAAEFGPDAPELDLSDALSSVKLGAMRARLADQIGLSDGDAPPGGIDLF